MIKDALKKIVPATYGKVESANRKLSKEINGLRKELSVLKEENISLERTVDSIGKTSKEMKNMLQDIKNNETKIRDFVSDNKKCSGEIKNLLEHVEKEYWYNNEYERKVIASFYEYYEREDYKELFLNLVSGLSDEDTELIVKILQRQRLAKESLGKEVDLFSREEQQQILEMRKELNMEIFRVADDMYCYKHYFLPIRHFEASVFCYKHGIDCIEHPEKIQNKDILDIGGFIGDSVLVLEPLTEKRIFTFEAVSEHYELIKKTVALNKLDNVVVENMAMGDHNGEIEIAVSGSASAINTNGVVKVSRMEKAKMMTLDSYVEQQQMDIGLIKVDIEGAEQSFLRGAKKTIEKYKPVLLLSIYHNADDFFHIKPMVESWNLGYKFRIHKPVDYTVSREVLLIAEVR